MLAAAQHSGSGAEAGAEGGDPLPLVSPDHPCKILNMTLQQEHVLGPDLGQHRSAGSAGGAAFEHQPRLVQAETHPPCLKWCNLQIYHICSLTCKRIQKILDPTKYSKCWQY